jgi:transposase
LCIDDFAKKKKHSYGTIFINADTNKIINIIDSREADDVTSELKKYPNLKIVSRDGSWTYGKAITNYNQNISQVTDRFHLLKNLTEKCCNIIASTIIGRVSVPIKEATLNELADYLLSDKKERVLKVKEKYKKGISKIEIAAMYNIGLKTVDRYIQIKEEDIKNNVKTVREIEHIKAINKTMKRCNKVRELFNQGKTIDQIAIETGFNKICIKEYIKDDFSPTNEHYGQKKEGIMPKFRDEIMKMYLSGKNSKEISLFIKEKGYSITPDAIRAFIIKEKRINKDLNISLLCSDVVDANTIKKLFFHENENEKIIPKFQLDSVMEQYPIIDKILTIHKSFKSILFGKDSKKLDEWISDVEKNNIVQLMPFIKTINNDLIAVKNAIDMKVNNGLAEGKVNLLKTIKRIMYGRASFTTLKVKLLMHEYSFSIN